MEQAQMATTGSVDAQAWPQSWDWEEFMFAGKLHRCGYATGRTMVLVVALGERDAATTAH